MTLLFTSLHSLLFKNPNANTTISFFALRPAKHSYLSFSLLPSSPNPKIRSSSIRFSSFSGNLPDPPSSKPTTTPGWNHAEETVNDDKESDGVLYTFVDEWGEKAEPLTKSSVSDPPKNEDEWGGGVSTPVEYVLSGNGSAAVEVGDANENKLEELKRCLVDTVYGTDLGFRASAEVRAEVLELVTQLEGLNPTAAPTDAVDVLDGNWVLLYTAFSELLPLLAAGTNPLLKVEKICQEINTSTLTIENSITSSTPFTTLSFSASAIFEVQSPSRIQVEFKEGTLQPPEIKSSLNLPENVDVFGQKINLSAVQQSLNPLQEAVAGVARTISGQPPLKIPIPGKPPKSWLLITYLDNDLRISRGDGGLFVLAKEGSPLLDQ